MCLLEYKQNKCDDPVPTIEKYCLNKKHCFEQSTHLNVNFIMSIVIYIIEIFNEAMNKVSFKNICLVILFGIVMIMTIDKSKRGSLIN